MMGRSASRNNPLQSGAKARQPEHSSGNIAKPELIVIYDSECSFCAYFAGRTARLDHPGKIELLSSRSKIPEAVAKNCDTNRLNDAVVAITVDGQAYYRAKAVAQILRRLPGPAKLIARIIDLPVIGLPADLIYRLVSRYRFLFGKFFG